MTTLTVLCSLFCIWHCVSSSSDNLSEDQQNFKPLQGDEHLGSSPWTYECINEECRKTLYIHSEKSSKSEESPSRISLDVCWLTCGKYGALWPYPKQIKLGNELVSFMPSDIKIGKLTAPTKELESLSKSAVDLKTLYFNELYKNGKSDKSSKSGNPFSEIFSNLFWFTKKVNTEIEINIMIEQANEKITLQTNETYKLTVHSGPNYKENVSKIFVDIEGATYFGVRHALETLTQLVAFDEVHNCLQILRHVKIVDEPSFPYRGLLIDTARNFIPIESLKRVVDAMSYNKLNIFHWHISDSNSFPFYSKRVPQMTQYGAYSEAEIYHPDEVSEFIEYARQRGVKILPELDAPAHAGNGWQWGPLKGMGNLSLCIDAEPFHKYCGQPPCGQLNPVNINTYLVLEKLYADMLDVFDNDLFHMGGDEVSFDCWKNTPDISQGLNHRKGGIQLWSFFQKTAFEKLRKINSSILPILWTSQLTGNPIGRATLSKKDYIIQVWEGKNSQQITDLLNEGYHLIMSNVDALYIDMGFGTWLGKNHKWDQKLWQTLYDNNLDKIAQAKASRTKSSKNNLAKQVLGGEATLWAEKVNEHNMEMKLWPRGAALAENLWSNPQSRSGKTYSRINYQNRRMIQRGIKSDQLQPLSCLQNGGHCINLPDVI